MHKHRKAESLRFTAAQLSNTRAFTFHYNTQAIAYAKKVPSCKSHGANATGNRHIALAAFSAYADIYPRPAAVTVGQCWSYTAIMNCKHHSCLRDEISPFKLAVPHSCPTKDYFPLGKKVSFKVVDNCHRVSCCILAQSRDRQHCKSVSGIREDEVRQHLFLSYLAKRVWKTSELCM